MTSQEFALIFSAIVVLSVLRFGIPALATWAVSKMITRATHATS